MFNVTHSTIPGVEARKPDFSWSYSRLKNYRACPKKMFHYDIAKDVKDEESEILKYGFEVHTAMAKRLEHGTALPHTFRGFEPWAAKFEQGRGQAGVKLLVEQKLAITREFSACGYWEKGAKGVWLRSVADAVKLVDNGTAMVGAYWDWKTGKIPSYKPKMDEAVQQLVLAAAALFSHYPTLQIMKCALVWLEFGSKTDVTVKRSDIPAFWGVLLPEVAQLEQAQATMTFPARPGGLCKDWCGVTSCPYYGQDNR